MADERYLQRLQWYLAGEVVYVGADGLYLCGFPSLTTVEGLADSIEEFYEEKTRRNSYSDSASISTFKLFPKNMQLKQPSKVTGSLLENIPRIAEQFEYEEDSEGTVYSSASKKKGSSTNSLNSKQVVNC